MIAMGSRAQPGGGAGRPDADLNRRAVRRGIGPALKLFGLVAGIALVAAGLVGGQFSPVDPVRAESSATQLLVASLLAPSLLSADVRLQDESGVDVIGTVDEVLAASYLAGSLAASPCGPLPSVDKPFGMSAALAEIRAHLATPAYETVAAAVAEWQRKPPASAYERILADLPAGLSDGLQCQVLHDIAADRLQRAMSRWNDLKPRLMATGL